MSELKPEQLPKTVREQVIEDLRRGAEFYIEREFLPDGAYVFLKYQNKGEKLKTVKIGPFELMHDALLACESITFEAGRTK